VIILASKDDLRFSIGALIEQGGPDGKSPMIRLGSYVLVAVLAGEERLICIKVTMG
jgi:hypothetical protein